ncbi:hypothetical protein EMCRGX_G002061 [Ephydatia muelleri]
MEAQLRSPGPGTGEHHREHMDYCGYVVLPMAIEQDVAIACALSGTQTPTWSPHPRLLILEEARLENPRGMDLLVAGSIPPSSGLSSSSALVCWVALVTVYANKLDNLLDKKRLVELHVHTKHYIGTEGRGIWTKPSPSSPSPGRPR